MDLFGRRTETAALDGLLAQAAGGAGCGLVLWGEPGMGKSALLDYAVEAAAAATVLCCRGTRMEASLAFAALHELLWPVREQRPKEPTRSPFAAFVVLLARQWGDAARFLLFALAAATALPAFVAAGGAIGAACALAGGWALREDLEAVPLRPLRLAMGVIVLILGIVIGLGARGII